MAYIKGTTAAGEIQAIRAAFARAGAAIKASPEPGEAFRDATALGELVQQMSIEAAGFRAYLAAEMHERDGVTLEDIGAMLGVSKARAAQLATAGKTRGQNMTTDPGTDPEPAPVALAIITSDLGVLVERRHDRVPPYTFPGGEIRPGESASQALIRRVPEETGQQVTPGEVLGRRLHPKTQRLMIYVVCAVEGTDVHVGDPDDLAEVRWITIADSRLLLPDMYPPIRKYLDGLSPS